jgi:chromosome segregation ATPase
MSQELSHEQWEPSLIVAGYRFAWFDGLNRFYIANEHWEHLSSAFTSPPNVFDDFIRATDTEHLSRIIGAEARAATAEARATAAETRATTAEARLAEANARMEESAEVAKNAVARAADAAARAESAEAQAEHAEARVAQAEARAQSAELRSEDAIVHANQADEKAARVEARAVAAEARAATAEAKLATIAARHSEALAEIAAIRASTSWRLTAPLRALGRSLRCMSRQDENRSKRSNCEQTLGRASVSGANVD